MTVAELIFDSSFGLALVLTFIQITPIKFNPWTSIGHFLGQALNKDVLNDLDHLKKAQKETADKLDEHIRIDDERSINETRSKILQFNTELMRGLPHTEEDFIDILSEIDEYDKYCNAHPEYPNKRAVHAKANIEREYQERLRNHDFLN